MLVLQCTTMPFKVEMLVKCMYIVIAPEACACTAFCDVHLLHAH